METKPSQQAVEPSPGLGRQPIRVCVVGPSLDIVGGQAIQASRLLERLREERELEVAFLPVNPRLPGILRALQKVKYSRTIVTSVLYLATLLASLRRFDVIHVFSASYLSYVLAPLPAILVSRLYGRKVILNYHSGEAEDHLRRWRLTAVPSMRLVDRVVVPSDYLGGVFGSFGLDTISIANFVELDSFSFRLRRPLRPVFLSNRNFEPHYNVACILRAFRIIQRHLPEARLMVAGDGSQRAELESLSRRLELRHVEFLGEVDPETMPEIYHACDIYLNASEIDNMPVSIIEAFAAGLPVVTTEAGGIPYIVSHEVNGLLVRRGDHEALASTAVRLLHDEALASRIVRRAYEDCRRLYRWEAVRRHWLDLYRTLSRDGAGAPLPAGTEAHAWGDGGRFS